MAYSPDGRYLASGGHDKSIILWAPRTGEVLRRLQGHQDTITSISFSPDGSRIASADVGGAVIIWDTDSGTALRALLGHEGVVSCVSFSLDGQLLATAGFDGTVRVFDPATGAETRCMHGHEDHVLCVAFGRVAPPGGASIAGELLDAWSGKKLAGDDSDAQSLLSMDSNESNASVASVASRASRTTIASLRSEEDGRSGFDPRRRSTFPSLGRSNLPEYEIPEAIIPVPNEDVGKVNVSELHKLLNATEEMVPDSAWLSIEAAGEIAQRVRTLSTSIVG